MSRPSVPGRHGSASGGCRCHAGHAGIRGRGAGRPWLGADIGDVDRRRAGREPGEHRGLVALAPATPQPPREPARLLADSGASRAVRRARCQSVGVRIQCLRRRTASVRRRHRGGHHRPGWLAAVPPAACQPGVLGGHLRRNGRWPARRGRAPRRAVRARGLLWRRDRRDDRHDLEEVPRQCGRRSRPRTPDATGGTAVEGFRDRLERLALGDRCHRPAAWRRIDSNWS